MPANICVHVQVGNFPSSDDIRVMMDLDSDIVYEIFSSIDKPDALSDPFSRALCSSSVVIEKVSMRREKLSKLLAEKLTHAILEAMESNDTVMGYR